MPRTKQVRKKSHITKTHSAGSKNSTSDSPSTETLISEEYESVEDFQISFNNYFDSEKRKHVLGYERAGEEVKKIIRNILEELPDHVKCANVHADVDVSYVGDQNEDPNVATASTSRVSRSQKPTESVEFKVPKARQATSRSSSRKRLPSATRGPPASTEGIKTPAMSSRKLPPGATITPKVYNDTPITVMRRPLHGEMAISLDGSPLMVGATSREDIPTVNVPLQDGRIFSIMPEEGAPPADLPYLDETTKKYLKTLREHLQILAPNSP